MAIANTFTPEILFDIALLAKNHNLDKIIDSENLLDEIIKEQELRESIDVWQSAFFGADNLYTFLALYRFLKAENYLPEIPDEQPNKEEDFDSIALDYMMEERNW